MATLVTATLAVLAAGCGDDDPATTTPTTGSPSTSAPSGEPGADLQIRYEHSEAGVSFEYGIECAGGSSGLTGDAERSEVDAAAACEALADPAVVDRLVEGPDDEICTEQYGGADVADISGTVSGEDVDARVDRTDGCGISDWDDLLDPILPPAIGVVPPTTSG